MFFQKKCVQYWPNKSEVHGDIEVIKEKEETWPDYCIRWFTLKQVDLYFNSNTSTFFYANQVMMLYIIKIYNGHVSHLHFSTDYLPH